MQFAPGDIVSLNGSDHQMVVISKLDARLLWVRLVHSDREDMYAFRPDDLRLIARAATVAAPPLVFTTVPQISAVESIAA